MQQQEIIKTTVDSLVNLINEKKSISIEEVSRTLHIPSAVINEWAEFLEQENILTIDYKKTIPYLEKKTPKTEIKKQKPTFDATEAKNLLEKVESYKGKLEKAEKDTNIDEEFLTKIRLQYLILIQNLNEFINTIQPEEQAIETFKKIKKRVDIFETNMLKL